MSKMKLEKTNIKNGMLDWRFDDMMIVNLEGNKYKDDFDCDDLVNDFKRWEFRKNGRINLFDEKWEIFWIEITKKSGALLPASLTLPLVIDFKVQ